MLFHTHLHMKRKVAGFVANEMTIHERFEKFVAGLEELSKKYDIVLRVTGGVEIHDQEDIVEIRYSHDETSSDLRPLVITYADSPVETPSMNL